MPSDAQRLWQYAFFCLLVYASLFSQSIRAQEIEARTYSNAPIGITFISAGIAQAKAGNYTLTSEAMSVTHIIDVGGQSGKLTLVLPYGQLTGSTTLGGRTVNASTEGLSDPLIKAAINLYGAPALTLDEFKSYQQDLIIGATLTASIPWGKYDDNQLINVGANRWFVQPGIGASKAIGPWRFELAGWGFSTPATPISWAPIHYPKIPCTQHKPTRFTIFKIPLGLLSMPLTLLADNPISMAT